MSNWAGSVLEEHNKKKERERREAEAKKKEEQRLANARDLRRRISKEYERVLERLTKTPG